VSPGLTADVSAQIGVYAGVVFIGLGLVGIGVVLGASWVIRRWENSLRRPR
jgi:uncharacterized membrane protein YhiD involved in acid resistance